MTRKHYNAFAELLELYRPANSDAAVLPADYRQLVRSIADLFAEDNDRFDRARFLAAVGYDPVRDDTDYLRHNER